MPDMLANEGEQAVGNQLLLCMETQGSSSMCCKLIPVYYAMEKVQEILKEQDEPELFLLTRSVIAPCDR